VAPSAECVHNMNLRFFSLVLWFWRLASTCHRNSAKVYARRVLRWSQVRWVYAALRCVYCACSVAAATRWPTRYTRLRARRASDTRCVSVARCICRVCIYSEFKSSFYVRHQTAFDIIHFARDVSIQKIQWAVCIYTNSFRDWRGLQRLLLRGVDWWANERLICCDSCQRRVRWITIV